MFACFRCVSRHVALAALTSLMVAAPSWGQPQGIQKGEVVDLAPIVTPTILKATAVEQNGSVVIRVSSIEIRLRQPAGNAKDAKGWLLCWTKPDPLVLGKQIRAYSPSGKKLDNKAVLKALKKPVAVACFQRKHKEDPEMPDPFYSTVFRDDVVILVFEAKLWLRQ